MRIGEYETGKLLGKGGMSEVYEASHIRLGSRHALKLFAFDKPLNEIKERFLIEGRLLARLNHPRIVKVTDYGTDENSGRPYLVMDLIVDPNGAVKSLADVTPGSVDEDEVGRWYDDIREGLAYIHANGVVHRDLKLENVLIGPDGHVILSDFGISKIDKNCEVATGIGAVDTLVRLRKGDRLAMGSVGYMAPELDLGAAASEKTDYFALGVIVYRLLTGSWCDSRTDVVSMLEGYDSAWRRIIPALIHASPDGRECISYYDEKRRIAEAGELEMENRFLALQKHVKTFECLAIASGVFVLLLVSLSVWLLGDLRHKDDRIAYLESRLKVPSFEDVFTIPECKDDDEKGEYEAALLDAFLLTRKTFKNLKNRDVTKSVARGEIGDMLTDMNPWGAQALSERLPENYSPLVNDEALSNLLTQAMEKLK